MHCRLGFDEIKSASELCTAAAQGKVDLIRHYIKAGINVNAADYDKRTALHIAAADGCLEAVRRMASSSLLAPLSPGNMKGTSAQLNPRHLHCGMWNVAPSRVTMSIAISQPGKVGQRPLCWAAHLERLVVSITLHSLAYWQAIHRESFPAAAPMSHSRAPRSSWPP